MKRLTNRFGSACAAFVIAAGVGGTALAASRETVIHNFNPIPFGGPIIDASTGVFYGVAGETIYQLSPPTAAHPKWTYNAIYIDPGSTTSINLSGAIYASNGVVYAGGFANSIPNTAKIFSLTPPVSGTGEWTLTVLHTFSSATEGGNLQGPLTMDANGALYGTASNGGGTGCVNNAGCGTVFKLTPPAIQGQAWTASILYKFSGGAGGYRPADGVILDKDGNLYGSALFDYPSGKSLIFRLTPAADGVKWTETVLYRFYPTSNCYSSGPLAIDANGALYGAFSTYASFGGGATCRDTANEYAFQLAPSKSNPNVWVRSYMHSFTSADKTDGYGLNAPLTIDASGNVYGATQNGGTADTGTVFALRPRAKVAGKWSYQALFGFATTTGGHYVNSTGATPFGGLLFDTAGALYGTTEAGGSGGHGVLFKLTQ
jgi:uncharacterized repeat protein (TIGR03803 family)